MADELCGCLRAVRESYKMFKSSMSFVIRQSEKDFENRYQMCRWWSWGLKKKHGLNKFDVDIVKDEDGNETGEVIVMCREWEHSEMSSFRYRLDEVI